MDSETLIDGLRRSDPAAARHLHDCLVPSIWRFVFFRVRKNAHLAEDIVSETVLALVDAVTADKQIDHPAAWLRTVATRRIQDHFRAVARVEKLLENGQQVSRSADREDAPAKHEQAERRQTVRDALDELPENYRLAMEWKYVDKLGVREIAERLNTTEKAAESILFRARNSLRKRLEHEFPDVKAAGAATNVSQADVDAKASQANVDAKASQADFDAKASQAEVDTKVNGLNVANVRDAAAGSRGPIDNRHARNIDSHSAYLGVHFLDGS